MCNGRGARLAHRAQAARTSVKGRSHPFPPKYTFLGFRVFSIPPYPPFARGGLLSRRSDVLQKVINNRNEKSRIFSQVCLLSNMFSIYVPQISQMHQCMEHCWIIVAICIKGFRLSNQVSLSACMLRASTCARLGNIYWNTFHMDHKRMLGNLCYLY